MVSSDFGKLEVRRHLTSGDDCAMAGEAMAVAAAPAAETFKKSRRFIQVSPWWGCCCPGISFERVGRRPILHGRRGSEGGRFNTDVRERKRDKGMTALIKPKLKASFRRRR